MKKICIFCNTTFEDESLEYCPNCEPPKTLPESLRVLMDYDEYERYLSQAQDLDYIKQSSNLPKCPACGSTNIRHISSAERGVNAVMFGLLGNKRKCQFECLNPNCRYRW